MEKKKKKEVGWLPKLKMAASTILLVETEPTTSILPIWSQRALMKTLLLCFTHVFMRMCAMDSYF